MIETKTFDIQKSKNELPNQQSKQNQTHVYYCRVTFYVLFYFWKGL